MRAAIFNAVLRRGRQITLPIENEEELIKELGIPDTDRLIGCVLELNISAIRYKSITYRISTTVESKKQKE